MGVSKQGGLFLGKGRGAYVDEIFSSDLVQHVQQPVGHQVNDEVDGIRAYQHERDGDSPVQETNLGEFQSGAPRAPPPPSPPVSPLLPPPPPPPLAPYLMSSNNVEFTEMETKTMSRFVASSGSIP